MRDSYNLRTPEGRYEFIKDTWPGTAGLAYAGYKAHDRGAVVFAPGYNYPMFVPRLTDFGYSNYPVAELEQLVNTYDPEKEIIAAFFLLDGNIAFGRYQVEDMPPPLAYQTFARTL